MRLSGRWFRFCSVGGGQTWRTQKEEVIVSALKELAAGQLH